MNAKLEQLYSTSDILVLKIISVLVCIKFELNYLSISYYTVSEFFSVLVSVKFFSSHFSSVSVSVLTSFQ